MGMADIGLMMALLMGTDMWVGMCRGWRLCSCFMAL